MLRESLGVVQLIEIPTAHEFARPNERPLTAGPKTYVNELT